MVAIQARFKKDDRPNDGLSRITHELTARPYERRIVIGIIRPVRSVKNYEDGTDMPTVKFDHIEALDGDAAKDAWEMIAEAYEERTGNPMPPVSLFDNPPPADPGDALDQDAIPGVDS